VKNTLAVVEALASQTAGKTVEEFREKFAGRLRALAQPHTLLVDSDWKSVDLQALLKQGLSAYHLDDGERLRLDGVSIAVTPKQALGLRMVVHELATNAVKYGALSNPNGSVHLSWQVEQIGNRQQRVRLHWEERGGPAVKAPTQTGFGSRMVKAAIEYDLGGEARLNYAPEGLTCVITFPIV
jgi:two-component system, chemotaxis family, CheB/CheR fusion protein